MSTHPSGSYCISTFQDIILAGLYVLQLWNNLFNHLTPQVQDLAVRIAER
jgi:hypothetical protein